MDALTIVVPYRDERAALSRLLASLPAGIPVIVIDDCSDVAPEVERPNTTVIRRETRGYFAGAVNTGIQACDTDVLVLNQDIWFTGQGWLGEVAQLREQYAVFGQGVRGHPAWPAGYIDGRLMFMRRDAIKKVGGLNERDWPLWGGTCEWQLRACRAGYRAKPLPDLDWYQHEREGRFGASIQALLKAQPERQSLYVRTPPMISVVIPSYNHGRYLPDAIHSLIGGKTSLGVAPGQTFAAFELIVVDDASTDDTAEIMQSLASPWTAVRYMRLGRNSGTAAANNAGIKAAYGKFIQILCADDMLDSHALETSYRIVERDPRVVPYTDMVLFNAGKRMTTWHMRDYDFDALIERNHVPAGIMFARSAWEAVGGYPESFAHGREDWAMAVALGRGGYCGVHVPRGLYLYRRHGDNRTLSNTTPEWRREFMAQMRAAFPDLYGKGERPVGCCGRGSKPTASGVTANTKEVDYSVGAEGMIALEYVGLSTGKQTWHGKVTHARYLFGGSHPRGWVDKRDAAALLELREGGRPLFRRYIAPKPVPIPEPPTAPALTEAAIAAADDEAPLAAALVVAALAEVEAPEVKATDIADMTVAAIRAALPGADAHLRAIWLEQERSGRNRATVLKLLGGAHGA